MRAAQSLKWVAVLLLGATIGILAVLVANYHEPAEPAPAPTTIPVDPQPALVPPPPVTGDGLAAKDDSADERVVVVDARFGPDRASASEGGRCRAYLGRLRARVDFYESGEQGPSTSLLVLLDAGRQVYWLDYGAMAKVSSSLEQVTTSATGRAQRPPPISTDSFFRAWSYTGHRLPADTTKALIEIAANYWWGEYARPEEIELLKWCPRELILFRPGTDGLTVTVKNAEVTSLQRLGQSLFQVPDYIDGGRSTRLMDMPYRYDLRSLTRCSSKTDIRAFIGLDGAPNAGLIVDKSGIVVVDPPLSPEIGYRLHEEALRAAGEQVRIGPGYLRYRQNRMPVTHVLNTTYRASHTFGNQAFRATANFVAANKAARHMADLLEGRSMRERLREFQVPGLAWHSLISATTGFDGTLKLHAASTEIEMTSVGDCVGEGDAIVYLPEHRVLFAGDLVLVGLIPDYHGRTRTVRHWIDTLRKLENELPKDVVIVPGHGPLGGRDLLRKQREFLEALAASAGEAIRSGKSAEMAERVRLPRYEGWLGYKEWLGGNVGLVHEELSGQVGRMTPGVAGTMALLPEPRDFMHWLDAQAQLGAQRQDATAPPDQPRR